LRQGLEDPRAERRTAHAASRKGEPGQLHVVRRFDRSAGRDRWRRALPLHYPGAKPVNRELQFFAMRAAAGTTVEAVALGLALQGFDVVIPSQRVALSELRHAGVHEVLPFWPEEVTF
jgi:hypothetical protein